MTLDERIRTYINSLDKGNPPYLERLYDDAVKMKIPVIRREMTAFLRTFLRIKEPDSILELGTAVGFSALLMAENTKKSCCITTVENYEKHMLMAGENFKSFDRENKIQLIYGDAIEVLDSLDGSFDLIFMDAAKAQYIYYLPKVKKLMKKGSVLISDNVLQEGDILESRFVIERRDRTIHKRMREYLFEVTHDEELETSVIPIGDGITLSVML